MKNKDNKINKKVSIFYYFTSICFYILAIISFINKNNSMAVIFICLGSTFLCLGSTYLNNNKK